MKRNVFSLQRLRRKLTFNYTLATMATLLALELLVSTPSLETSRRGRGSGRISLTGSPRW